MGTASTPTESARHRHGSPRKTRLKNHAPRSRTTVHGTGAFVIGWPFLGVGVLIILVVLDVIPGSGSSAQDAPRWVGVLGGGIFAFAGAWLTFHGCSGIKRKWRGRRQQALGAPPWFVDHAWNSTGIDADRRGVYSSVAGIVICGLFLAVAVGMAEVGGHFVLYAVAGLLGMILLAVLVHTGRRLSQGLKYGRCRLEFRRFPYFLGEQMEATFVAPRGIPHCDSLLFTLRCVEEAYVTQGHGESRAQTVVSDQLYHDELCEDALQETAPLPLVIDFAFSLPDPAPATSLKDRPPRYWELEVESATPGVDFRSAFLVPVYARLR